MTDPKINLKNVSNAEAFGVEWTNGSNGNRFMLVNVRGTLELLFSVRSEHDTKWRTTAVRDPARFGMTRPPPTAAEFLNLADRYVNGS